MYVSRKDLILLAFTGKNIMRMSELSETMSLTTSSSMRMSDSRVKEGLVERGYDKFDRRLLTVGLTGNSNKIAKDLRHSEIGILIQSKIRLKTMEKKRLCRLLRL